MTQDVLNMLSVDREKDENIVKSGTKVKNSDAKFKGRSKVVDVENKRVSNEKDTNNENEN